MTKETAQLILREYDLNDFTESFVQELKKVSETKEESFYTIKNEEQTYFKGKPESYHPKESLYDLHKSLTSDTLRLMKAKNNDYSYGNDPYNNFRGSDMLGVSPIIGILLRMQDKMMRIKTFALSNNLNVKEESVNDSIIDLINYVVLIAGYIEYEKNKETKV
jgi:hypothetical protein